ncbi:hypothetical protein [Sinomonas atrocyanea]
MSTEPGPGPQRPLRKLAARIAWADEEARSRPSAEAARAGAEWGPGHEDYAEAIRALTDLGY